MATTNGTSALGPAVGEVLRDESPRHRRPRTVPASTSWLSPKDAARHLGVSVNVIYDACATRGLRHSKLGHSTIRIRTEWLDQWAETFVR